MKHFIKENIEILFIGLLIIIFIVLKKTAPDLTIPFLLLGFVALSIYGILKEFRLLLSNNQVYFKNILCIVFKSIVFIYFFASLFFKDFNSYFMLFLQSAADLICNHLHKSSEA